MFGKLFKQRVERERERGEPRPQWIEIHLYVCGSCGAVQGTTIKWTPREREDARCAVCKCTRIMNALAYHPGTRRFVLPY